MHRRQVSTGTRQREEEDDDPVRPEKRDGRRGAYTKGGRMGPGNHPEQENHLGADRLSQTQKLGAVEGGQWKLLAEEVVRHEPTAATPD